MALNNSINTPPPFLVASGGTGITSYTIGDLLYASGTTALSKLADVATGNALISGGVGVAPSWGKIGLTTHVSGILPVANGGTGTSTAFTQGSVVFAGASGVYSQNNANLFWDNTNGRLGIGTTTPGAFIDVVTTSGIDSTISIRAIGASPGNASLALITGSATKSAAIGCTAGSNLWSFGITSTDGNFYLTGGSPVVNVIAANYTTSDVTISTGNLLINTAGKGLQVKSATVSAGTANATLVRGVVLTGGTATVNNSAVTTNHVGFAQRVVNAGTAGYYRVVCNAGNFVVTSNSGADASTLSVLLVLAT